jgi:phosphoglycolate phosphatase-like HAD superfamily hydrolase
MISLILFDIDGTLLNIHGAGKRAFSRALKSVFGWTNDLAHINFAGATDLLVLRRLMEEHGQEPTRADEERFFDHLPEELEEAISESEHTLHPGSREILQALERRGDCVVGLVTGNIRSCAMIKLRAFQLDHYFRFGGFGDDHAHRGDIARAAVERAGNHVPEGSQITAITLIGDALSDVAAAKEIGARSIAVGTGWHGREELVEAGADVVLDDLGDTARVCEALGVSGEPS